MVQQTKASTEGVVNALGDSNFSAFDTPKTRCSRLQVSSHHRENRGCSCERNAFLPWLRYLPYCQSKQFESLNGDILNPSQNFKDQYFPHRKYGNCVSLCGGQQLVTDWTMPQALASERAFCEVTCGWFDPGLILCRCAAVRIMSALPFFLSLVETSWESLERGSPWSLNKRLVTIGTCTSALVADFDQSTARLGCLLLSFVVSPKPFFAGDNQSRKQTASDKGAVSWCTENLQTVGLDPRLFTFDKHP